MQLEEVLCYYFLLFEKTSTRYKNMRTLISLLICLLASSSLFAQEGHPLKGTWRGTITTGSNTRPLVIIMDYKGNEITGMINPGRNSYNFTSAELDAPNWVLQASATTREAVDISFQATLKDIGARNRYLEGSWSEEGSSYPFKIIRE